MTFHYLHMDGCPCSRCRVSRNYARILATVAPGDEAVSAENVAAQLDLVAAEPERRDLDVVGHR